MNRLKHTTEIMTLMQTTYVSLEPMRRATRNHSLSILPLATSSAPEAVCGKARRIGYGGSEKDSLALYRLKVRLLVTLEADDCTHAPARG